MMDITNNSDVIPPLIEELSKLLALTFSIPFGVVFTFVFASIEFVNYLVQINDSYGGITWQYYFMRIMCFLLHITCLYIQMAGFKLYERINWRGYIIISFICAWISHVLWNESFGQVIYSIILQF